MAGRRQAAASALGLPCCRVDSRSGGKRGTPCGTLRVRAEPQNDCRGLTRARSRHTATQDGGRRLARRGRQQKATPLPPTSKLDDACTEPRRAPGWSSSHHAPRGFGRWGCASHGPAIDGSEPLAARTPCSSPKHACCRARCSRAGHLPRPERHARSPMPASPRATSPAWHRPHFNAAATSGSWPVRSRARRRRIGPHPPQYPSRGCKVCHSARITSRLAASRTGAFESEPPPARRSP
jgi:hypothetical protein